ncbi:MAG: 3-phosphoshikimate 1-carboxyvinyltransferase [Spirochaetaceae bacterium]|jgi:3-phosphoshikimate 1-carboxyvinyltransferase|nr:3-phosphoshikimate 1-carboxyvinyltransferase [Spirochaetaceae bacterium]
MNVLVKPHCFSGTVNIPASKSHTIRRLLIAALADGRSRLLRPLDSLDTRSCASVCALLGAGFSETPGEDACWDIDGIGSGASIKAPAAPLDVGNSGTTLFLAIAIAALSKNNISFTGDKQIETRSAAPLLNALSGLGVNVESRNGCVPITVKGPVCGGRVSLECVTSQYLSALLLAAPLAEEGSVIEIDVPLLNERPYIEMTLSYLKRQNIKYKTNAGFSYFRIEGGAKYKPICGEVTGDFSSAAFPALAAALSGGKLCLTNLDPQDNQGDKLFFEILKQSGCKVEWLRSGNTWRLEIERSGALKAFSCDLNATPDMLPACAVLGAFSHGRTKLYNAAHARLKETDRIAVMAAELKKLGVNCVELPDGLEIDGMGASAFDSAASDQAAAFDGGQSAGAAQAATGAAQAVSAAQAAAGAAQAAASAAQTAAVSGGIAGVGGSAAGAANSGAALRLNGYDDHRVVMALACAGIALPGGVLVSGAEAASVTYPGFLELIGKIC